VTGSRRPAKRAPRRTAAQRYRILKYPWHTPHDYELAKIPHDFYYLTNTPRAWATSQRPVPPSVHWVPNLDHLPTDVMILHLDQWAPFELSKRFLFLRFRDSYPGPKIVINHGCNMVDGCSREVIADLVSGCTMVSNSITAHETWNIPGSRFIRHGMSPEEWPPTDYARHEVVIVQAYGRIHQEYRNVSGVELIEKTVPVTWVGRDRKFNTYNKYRHFLQSSSIFLQPSFASPNPRSRTEAMLTGLAIVTTNSHGEDEYIENGVNGYASNDIDELSEFLGYLLANPDQVRKIGRAGRETAQTWFHIDRFAEQWNQLLTEVVA